MAVQLLTGTKKSIVQHVWESRDEPLVMSSLPDTFVGREDNLLTEKDIIGCVPLLTTTIDAGGPPPKGVTKRFVAAENLLGC